MTEELTTTKSREMVGNVEIQEEGAIVPRQTFLAARTAVEMAQAQTSMVEWFRLKLADEKHELAEFESIVRHAKSHKWNTRNLAPRVSRQKKRITFYEKCLLASTMGYMIVPEFEVDIVAIRTIRDEPLYESMRREGSYNKLSRSDLRNDPAGEHAAGVGHYVSALPTGRTWMTHEKKEGKDIDVSHVETMDYTDPEFPVTVATPVIIEAVGQAMKGKIFDEIAVCPSSGRGSDPIVIGRVCMKQGYNWKRINFLIGWCVDLRML